jgi:hypothetical protein
MVGPEVELLRFSAISLRCGANTLKFGVHGLIRIPSGYSA